MSRPPLSIGMIFGLTLLFSTGYAADQDRVSEGDALFQQWCAPCHAPAPKELFPGTLSLAVKYKEAKPAALEQRTELSAVLVKLVVRKGIQSMPSFRKTEISDVELDSIATYLTRNQARQ